MATRNQSSGSDQGSTSTASGSSQQRSGALSGDQGSGGRAPNEQLADKAGEVKQNLQEIGGLAREAAVAKATELRDVAQQKAGELRDTANEYYEMGRERAVDFEQSIESRIREKPLNSVLIAAGVGMLVGILWMRR